MADREEALRKIKKLLQHAGGAGHHSEDEVENALKHARRMMDQFNISLQEAQSVDPGDARKQMKDRIVQKMVYGRAGKLDNFDAVLAEVVTDICDVRCFYRKVREAKTRGVGLCKREWVLYVGLPEDVQMAEQLYMELLTTMRTLARVTVGKGSWHSGHDSFCVGFVSRTRVRSKMITNYSQQESNTTAIVLAKGAVVEEYVEETMKVSKKGRNSDMTVKNQTNYEQGRSAADDVSLGEKGRVTA